MTNNDSLFHNRKSVWCFFPTNMKYISYMAEQLEALSQSFPIPVVQIRRN